MGIFYTQQGSATSAQQKVKVSANDTTAGYLEDKIVVPATSGLAKSTLNDGADEDVQIAIDINSTTDKAAPVSADELLIGDSEDSNAIKKADILSVASAMGVNPASTFTISATGADYTTIQAALTANATAGALFLVYPGTYTNDTINFTADRQTVASAGKGNNVIVTNSSQVVEAADYAGCKLKNIRINFTPTTAINGIEVNNGTLSTNSCRFDLTTSSTIAGTTQPALLAVTGTGTLTTKFGEFTYQHTGNTTTGIKTMFSVATGGTIDCLRPCASSMTNSGTAAATAISIDAGTGVLKITNACDFKVTDTAAGIVAGLGYIAGSGVNEFEYCRIEVVGGGGNNCYAVYNGGTGTIRSAHNIIKVTSGTANYSFFTGASATTTSIMDDVRAVNETAGTGNFFQASSQEDGKFAVSAPIEPSLTIHNVTKEDTDAGREAYVIFKGEQSGGEVTTLARIIAQHDGTSDDQKGDFIIQTNDGSDGDSPTERLRIDSAGLHTVTGAMTVSSTLGITGITTTAGRIKALATKTGDYSMTTADEIILADGTSATVDITLPTPAAGRIVTIKAINIGNTVRILPNGAETMDGAANYTFVAQYEARTLISNGTNWFVTGTVGAVLL